MNKPRNLSSKSFGRKFETVFTAVSTANVYPDPGHANAPNDLSPARAINIVTSHRKRGGKKRGK
ncbi:LIM domain-binding protein 2 [Temnothorax longispinosus]|uniref:LIM domain-binding protein 2 n=1 Tax=Temnothorax longispinosus TaxID=300112 RepID=A0A4S2KHA3_9HYME|nr:LIM domain-binding protein 2 [Temnothorax longispinosus]